MASQNCRTLYLRPLCFRTAVPNLVLEFRWLGTDESPPSGTSAPHWAGYFPQSVHQPNPTASVSQTGAVRFLATVLLKSS